MIEVTAFGQTKTMKQWAKQQKIDRRTLAYRIANGWDIKRALTEKAVNGNNQFLIY
jgi:hypothetical protein